MLSRADEFRANALECQKLADFFGGLIRRQYEELARQWLELAERLDNKALERSVAVQKSAPFSPRVRNADF
jgi:hypothetical protein